MNASYLSSRGKTLQKVTTCEWSQYLMWHVVWASFVALAGFNTVPISVSAWFPIWQQESGLRVSRDPAPPAPPASPALTACLLGPTGPLGVLTSLERYSCSLQSRPACHRGQGDQVWTSHTQKGRYVLTWNDFHESEVKSKCHRPWVEKRQRHERSTCCSKHHRHILLISQKYSAFQELFGDPLDLLSP